MTALPAHKPATASAAAVVDVQTLLLPDFEQHRLQLLQRFPAAPTAQLTRWFPGLTQSGTNSLNPTAGATSLPNGVGVCQVVCGRRATHSRLRQARAILNFLLGAIWIDFVSSSMVATPQLSPTLH
jgi:hypothetical protein